MWSKEKEMIVRVRVGVEDLVEEGGVGRAALAGRAEGGAEQARHVRRGAMERLGGDVVHVERAIGDGEDKAGILRGGREGRGGRTGAGWRA